MLLLDRSRYVSGGVRSNRRDEGREADMAARLSEVRLMSLKVTGRFKWNAHTPMKNARARMCNTYSCRDTAVERDVFGALDHDLFQLNCSHISKYVCVYVSFCSRLHKMLKHFFICTVSMFRRRGKAR